MKKKIFTCLATIALVSFLWSSGVNAESVSFSWKPNTTDADFDHYNFYRGSKSGEYDDAINVGKDTFYVIELAKGTHYLAVKGVDTSGNESNALYEIKYVIPMSPVTGFGSP